MIWNDIISPKNVNLHHLLVANLSWTTCNMHVFLNWNDWNETSCCEHRKLYHPYRLSYSYPFRERNSQIHITIKSLHVCTSLDTFYVELWTHLHHLCFCRRKTYCNPAPDFILKCLPGRQGFIVLLFVHWKMSPCRENKATSFTPISQLRPRRIHTLKPQSPKPSMWKVYSYVLKATEYICLWRAIILISRPFNSPCVPEQSVFLLKRLQLITQCDFMQMNRHWNFCSPQRLNLKLKIWEISCNSF